MMEPGSLQWYKTGEWDITGHKLKEEVLIRYKEKVLRYEDDLAVEEVIQRGCGIFVLRGFQDLAGQLPQQPGPNSEWTLLRTGIWAWDPLRSLSAWLNLSAISILLWTRSLLLKRIRLSTPMTLQLALQSSLRAHKINFLGMKLNQKACISDQ